MPETTFDVIHREAAKLGFYLVRLKTYSRTMEIELLFKENNYDAAARKRLGRLLHDRLPLGFKYTAEFITKRKERKEMRSFLVYREGIKSSSFWPMVVEVEGFSHGEVIPPEHILELAFDKIDPNYRPEGYNYRYVIVPMENAVRISPVPIRNYEYVVKDYVKRCDY